jgi:hypothetical protein
MRRDAYHFLPNPNQTWLLLPAQRVMLAPHLGCARFPGGEIFKMKVTFGPGCGFPIANIEVVCMITWTIIFPLQEDVRRF